SQQNALQSAEQYLQTSAFSEAGLIEQLSAEAGSKYPHADAVFAVEHLHVNWNEQAVRSAKEYLSTSSFSCQGLIEQLSSEAGSKFTAAQAEYAANKVGLC
ncbi:MAG TPA: Ltp family lipoprotein, partial [Solirubrobacteraceae bacterium]|nr:Ltp family lipoprotein [Solirubrobacteraceae bacterium]